ncbi:NmrA/HSCARG family protein [Streptosporangium sp. NPDC049376]|uniref:NmrA/HSCARG family protein n=1 Tax=Streptosporangium sp. NPDC049376 TaxID=3366192 RepID=UPI0037AFC93E
MPDPVLVTGATGKQGGAVARALLAAGTPVRVLLRDPESEPARAVLALGAEPVLGDLDDPASLTAAVTGVRGVFSVQLPDLTNLMSDGEAVRGRNLVEAARAAGVAQFVHTSVSGAGDEVRAVPGWTPDEWSRHYWASKAHVDDLVRTAGFPHWTILKPATFMENLLGRSYMFGDWAEQGFVTAFAKDTRLSLVAVPDIGAAAAAAFADPARFTGADVELAGDLLTMTEIAEILSGVLGRTVEAPVLSAEQAVARGLPPMMVNMQQQMNVLGQAAHPEHAHAFGLTMTGFAAWARDAFGGAHSS